MNLNSKLLSTTELLGLLLFSGVLRSEIYFVPDVKCRSYSVFAEQSAKGV